MPLIEVSLLKDASGFPTETKIKQGIKELIITYDEAVGFKISGPRTMFTPELLNILSLIYPTPKTPQLTVPQPLQVTAVEGGKTLLFDDMEGALLKWWTVAGFGTASLDNTFAFNGAQSLKLVCAAAEAIAQSVRYFPIHLKNILEIDFKWCISDLAVLNVWSIQLDINTGTQTIQAMATYTRATRTWSVSGAGGANVDVFTEPVQYDAKQDVAGAWHRLILRINLASYLYESLQVNEKKHIIDSTPLSISASASVLTARLTLTVNNVAGNEVIGWFDDFTVTEE